MAPTLEVGIAVWIPRMVGLDADAVMATIETLIQVDDMYPSVARFMATYRTKIRNQPFNDRALNEAPATAEVAHAGFAEARKLLKVQRSEH